MINLIGTYTLTPLGINSINQTDREVFESTLEAALSSGDVPELNPPGTKGFGTHTKHQGGGGRKGPPPSISRTRNATNLKPLEGLGVSFKVSKNFKLV